MIKGKGWTIPLILLLFIGFAEHFIPAAPPVSGPPPGPLNSGDVAWMLTATALVLLMTPGLSFFYGGMVNRKNVISTMLQSFICMGIISIAWIVFGFSLAFGDSIGGIIGNPLTFFMFRGVGEATHPTLSPTIPLALFALFQLKFAIITPALITGAFAERVRFSSYILFILLFNIFIYSPIAHWTWHPDGIFRKWGVLDFAGGTVVHMSAGFAALAGAWVFGQRKFRGRPSEGHSGPANIAYILLGTGLLWFGWFGFNAGSALAANAQAVQAFLATNTASASAMIAWLFLDVAKGRKPSAVAACVGAVVGLVAVTPAAGFVSVGSSIIIGSIAAVISNYAVHWTSKSNIDDTLDVFPCHGVGGLVGMILTAVFAKDVGLIFGQTQVFKYQMLALAIVIIYSALGSYFLYRITNLIVPLRVNEKDEEIGLDLSQHDEVIGMT